MCTRIHACMHVVEGHSPMSEGQDDATSQMPTIAITTAAAVPTCAHERSSFVRVVEKGAQAGSQGGDEVGITEEIHHKRDITRCPCLGSQEVRLFGLECGGQDEWCSRRCAK